MKKIINIIKTALRSVPLLQEIKFKITHKIAQVQPHTPRDKDHIDPKDMIKNLSVEQLSKTADDYFLSVSDPTQLMAKPFSSFNEISEQLQNLGNLFSEMQLGKSMTVLEFASGSCWLSRYLTQMGCKTISCDVSDAALNIGKELYKKHPIIGPLMFEPSFIKFNGHAIDLPDNSVDRIICFDGFHHIPNQEEILSELGRVLKQGGIVGFCEPGRYHSQSPHSQFEMKEFNVLENDIDIDQIVNIAYQYGFTNFKCKYINDMTLSLEDYHAITNYKIDRTLSHSILSSTYQHMLNKTVFFLYKGDFYPDSRMQQGLQHKITSTTELIHTTVGINCSIPLKIHNTGTAKWLTENISNLGIVHIGTHLYDENNALVDFDYSRHDLPQELLPDASVEHSIDLSFNKPGQYSLQIDLVAEDIMWFASADSALITIKVLVAQS